MIFPETRVYVAACQQARLARLPKQLARLNLPYTLEREEPSVPSGVGLLDSPSRRFRQQVTSEVDRPLLWLEDDIDVPYNFREIWTHYERTLPKDWHVVVFGWGIIMDCQEIKIRCVTPGWWHLEGGTNWYASFDGAQAILVNRGDWRLKLKDKEFRCDSMLCAALKDVGVTEVYHTDTILIGTNDPQDSFGNRRIMKPKMATPIYHSPTRGIRKVKESDFIGQIIPINTFTVIPNWLRNLWQ